MAKTSSHSEALVYILCVQYTYEKKYLINSEKSNSVEIKVQHLNTACSKISTFCLKHDVSCL